MTILIQSRPSNGASLLVCSLRETGVNALRRSAGATSGIRRSSMLVNWGCSQLNVGANLNEHNNVRDAINKLECLNTLADAGVSIPQYMTDTEHVPIRSDAGIWLARHALTGSGGEGITVVRAGDTYPQAPLYVKYVPKLVEFRVHTFRILNETRTLVRQKLRVSGAEQSRDQRLIRNHDNGWVFGLVRDEEGARKAEGEAVKALEALGLDFGALDVIIGRDDGKAYVLECNTAPGLEAPATVEFYRDNILSYYNSGVWRC